MVSSCWLIDFLIPWVFCPSPQIPKAPCALIQAFGGEDGLTGQQVKHRDQLGHLIQPQQAGSLTGWLSLQRRARSKISSSKSSFFAPYASKLGCIFFIHLRAGTLFFMFFGGFMDHVRSRSTKPQPPNATEKCRPRQPAQQIAFGSLLPTLTSHRRETTGNGVVLVPLVPLHHFSLSRVTHSEPHWKSFRRPLASR